MGTVMGESWCHGGDGTFAAMAESLNLPEARGTPS